MRLTETEILKKKGKSEINKEIKIIRNRIASIYNG